MRRFVLAFIVAATTLASPAFASGPDCPCESERAQLMTFRNKLANAESPDAAREMALSKTRLSHKAIDQAEKLFPNDPEIAAAEQRLDTFEDGVARAQSQEEVAMQFDNLMVQQVAGGCEYTPVEVAVIVIGFLLGIIPGIIFLFLFC